MGANIGSTVTAQLLAFDLAAYSLGPVAIGFFMLFTANIDVPLVGTHIRRGVAGSALDVVRGSLESDSPRIILHGGEFDVGCLCSGHDNRTWIS